MRQAGRYLPEYRELRSQVGAFLELCYTPRLACAVTLQPVRRFDLDAAILFSDILVVPDALGCRVRFVEGEGPQLEPVRERAALDGLRFGRMAPHLAPVYDAVARVRQELPREIALIGFAGAPWTVAAYMVEGRSAPEFYVARALARRDPGLFGHLIEMLVEATVGHLSAQVTAGADVVQLFDSWAGLLPEPEFERWCCAPTARIVTEFKRRHPKVPVIAFPRGAGVLYQKFAQAVPTDGLGLDTTVPLAWARRALGDVCLQGNLDPAALLAGREFACAETTRIVRTLGDRPFIFNLGHGVLPQTDPEVVAAVVAEVRAMRHGEGWSSAARPDLGP